MEGNKFRGRRFFFLIFGWLVNFIEIKKLLVIGIILLMFLIFLIGFLSNYMFMIVFCVI